VRSYGIFGIRQFVATNIIHGYPNLRKTDLLASIEGHQGKLHPLDFFHLQKMQGVW